MKNVINCLAISMIVLLALASCNKSEDTAVSKVYAPNNVLVSESMDDLTQTIANSIEVDAKDLSIESISYLDVKKGFAAQVDLYNSATDEHTRAYYISSLLKDDIRHDSSVKVADEVSGRRKTPTFNDGAVATCSCGLNSSSSNECIVSASLNPHFVISLECIPMSCYNTCYISYGYGE